MNNITDECAREILKHTKTSLMCAIHTKKPLDRIAEDLLLKIESALSQNKVSDVNADALEDLKQLLSEVYQLLTGYSQDETWSQWDEEVRVRLIKYQYYLESIPKEDKPIEDFNEQWNKAAGGTHDTSTFDKAEPIVSDAVAKAFDAGYKRREHELTLYSDGFNYALGEKLTPNKEQYLKSLLNK